MSQLPLFRETVATNVITKIRNDVRTGKSGEHLGLAKLTRWDYDAHDAPQDSAYEVIIDHHGRVLRVQVKTRSSPRVHFGTTGCSGETGARGSYVVGSPRREKHVNRSHGTDRSSFLVLR